MSAPTAPTDTSIVTMAYKDFGISAPSASQVARAISDGIEWVKRDLCDLGRSWQFMVKKAYFPTQVGVSRYAAPSDYVKFIEARIGFGTYSGTCQAGSTATCSLASGFPAAAQSVGKTIVFTSGSGAKQAAQIASLSGVVVTFDVALSTAVDNTTKYLIVDTWSKLGDDDSILNLDGFTIPSISMKPTLIVEDPDDTPGGFFFNYTPDQVYAIEFRYFGDLLLEDLTSTRYSRFLREGCSILTQGVFVWLLQDDTRYQTQMNIYLRKRREFANRWVFGYDKSKLQMTTGEE